jgi:Flp pilus assembly pilin Flp
VGRDRFGDERGASLVEYALLVALIAVVCVAAVTQVGRSSSNALYDAGRGGTAPNSAAFQNVFQNALYGVPLTPEGSALAAQLNPPTFVGGSSFSVTPKSGTLSFVTVAGGRVTSANVVVDLANPSVPKWTAGGVLVDPSTIAIH